MYVNYEIEYGMEYGMAYGMVENLVLVTVIGYRNESGLWNGMKWKAEMEGKLKQKAKLKLESRIIANYINSQSHLISP